jgi:hypothetical protein
VSGGSGSGGEVTRTERIQQLRAQHQRRHAERHRQYPLDEKEERYEAVLRQVSTEKSFRIAPELIEKINTVLYLHTKLFYFRLLV